MPANIRFQCSHCRKTLSADPQRAGKRAACPSCKTPVQIPFPPARANPHKTIAAKSSKRAPFKKPATHCQYCDLPLRLVVKGGAVTGQRLCVKCQAVPGICPFCRSELRTNAAQQCPHCGLSWRCAAASHCPADASPKTETPETHPETAKAAQPLSDAALLKAYYASLLFSASYEKSLGFIGTLCTTYEKASPLAEFLRNFRAEFQFASHYEPKWGGVGARAASIAFNLGLIINLLVSAALSGTLGFLLGYYGAIEIGFPLPIAAGIPAALLSLIIGTAIVFGEPKFPYLLITEAINGVAIIVALPIGLCYGFINPLAMETKLDVEELRKIGNDRSALIAKIIGMGVVGTVVLAGSIGAALLVQNMRHG